MKKIFLVLAVIFSLNIGTNAPTHAQSRTGDTTDVIGAQLNVTRAAVDQLVRKLGERQAQNQFSVKDYKTVAPQFQIQVEQGLARFEDAMKNSIMKKIGFWVDRYNQIYNSPDFSDDQKVTILKKQMALIQEQLDLIKKEYHEEIFKVYQLAGNMPYRLRMYQYQNPSISGQYGIGCADQCEKIAKAIKKYRLEMRRRHYQSYFLPVPEFFVRNPPIKKDLKKEDVFYYGGDHRNGTIYVTGKVQSGNGKYYAYALNGSYVLEGEQFNKYMKDLYQQEVFPLVASGCRSQLCVSLKVSDINFFVGLASETIDREIRIVLIDRKELVIKPLDLETEFFENLLNTTDYPVELPFDTE